VASRTRTGIEAEVVLATLTLAIVVAPLLRERARLPAPHPATEVLRSSGGLRPDVNSAPPIELAALPGLGLRTAYRIVAYRERIARFGSIDDLAAVPGIGPSLLERLRRSLVVNAP
jgi:competence protein ComEA